MQDEYNLLKLLELSDVITDAPNRISLYDKHYIVTLGIGSDHTASLWIGHEDLEELCNRNGVEFDTFLGERYK